MMRDDALQVAKHCPANAKTHATMATCNTAIEGCRQPKEIMYVDVAIKPMPLAMI
jgi:hypothetical protein